MMDLENPLGRRKRCVSCRKLHYPIEFVPTKNVCLECDLDGYEIACTKCGDTDRASNFPKKRRICWKCLAAKNKLRTIRAQRERIHNSISPENLHDTSFDHKLAEAFLLRPVIS